MPTGHRVFNILAPPVSAVNYFRILSVTQRPPLAQTRNPPYTQWAANSYCEVSACPLPF